MLTQTITSGSRERRPIGPWGTGARAAVGVGLVVWAALTGIQWYDALVGVVAVPALLIVLVGARGRSARPLRISDPEAPALMLLAWIGGAGLTIALPQAGLLFFGGSMLVAAARGIKHCEVLAVPNLLFRRDDEIYCCVFTPIDSAEAGIAPRQIAEAPYASARPADRRHE